MRNTVLQLCLWVSLLLLCHGRPHTPWSEGRLQGNLFHLFHYHPQSFFSGPGPSVLPAASILQHPPCFPPRCPFILLIGLTQFTCSSALLTRASQSRLAGVYSPRSVRLHPFAVNMHSYRCCPASRVAASSSSALPSSLNFHCGFQARKVVRKSCHLALFFLISARCFEILGARVAGSGFEAVPGGFGG